MSSDLLVKIAAGAALLVYTIALFLWWRSLVRRRERRREHEGAFVPLLLKAARNGTATCLADVVDLYRAHFDELALTLGERVHLSQLIRKAELSIAAEGKVVDAADVQETLPLLRRTLAENEEVVRQEEVRVPFSDTPSPERQLLQDVLELTAGDRDAVRTKLTEIARAVSARRDTIERLGDEGRQSLKWAKLGLLGTVAFSLISIVLGAWALFK